MYYQIDAPLTLSCHPALPASKSISNRVLILNHLSGNHSEISNLSDCDDTFVMKKALSHPSEITDIMAAGTAMRFLTAYFSVSKYKTLLTGTPRMLQRPIHVLVNALRSLGANIRYMGQEGFPPLLVEGRQLQGGEIELEGSVSSQFTSALLMIGPVLENGLTLHLKGNIISRPYIEMTLHLMREYGAHADWKDECALRVEGSGYTPKDFIVENDWSASSYWYEMVALSNDPNACIHLKGLFPNSTQGDAEVKRLFEPLGVMTLTDPEGGIVLRKSSVALPEEVVLDLEGQPDLAQTLVVTCAMLGRPFRITGLQTLKIKETDRLKALKNELAKLGIAIKSSGGDTLSWNGKCTPIDGIPLIDTYDDHRMAMAFAPCCLRTSTIRINQPTVVSKSYPRYWKELQAAGFTLADS